MNTPAQLDVFDQPYHGTPPHQAHSRTSFAAAEAILPNAATLRRKVLDFIAGRGAHGATDDEIKDALGLIGSTERPRRRELVLLGFVTDSGACRNTQHGRKAVVWCLADHDRAADPLIDTDFPASIGEPEPLL